MRPGAPWFLFFMWLPSGVYLNVVITTLKFTLKGCDCGKFFVTSQYESTYND